MGQTVIVFQEDCILTAAGREGKYPAITEVERFDLQGQGGKISGAHRGRPVRFARTGGFVRPVEAGFRKAGGKA